jgi:hypothetical protein
MTKNEYKKLCDILLLVIDDATFPVGIGELYRFIMAKRKEIIKRMARRKYGTR